MEEEIREVFGQLSDRISEEEFIDRVEEKVSLMGGLCDRATAAMLVAREMGVGEVEVKIKNIKPESGMVTFRGRVISVSDIREFKRSDGSVGRVANLTVGDETGTIRVALWDEVTEFIDSGDVRVDQSLKVRGVAKEGLSGTEVSVGRNCSLQEVEEDVQIRVDPHKISEICRDMEVNLLARVLDPGQIREFVRKDGSRGQVRTVLLGDETGKMRMTLWNDRAAMELEEGETLEVINASSRERYGQVEIQTGGYTLIKKSDVPVQFQEKMTPISDLEVGKTCSISGYVSGLGEVREFQRDDGSVGRVANIHVSDQSGRVKVALWGEHARLIEGIDLGFAVEILDGQTKSGWNEELEVSCGWQARITFTPPE
ncbi:MAG: replication protein A [Methanosarcinales archaeon]|nr:replication protein A [Methanosarcinales archaeon]